MLTLCDTECYVLKRKIFVIKIFFYVLKYETHLIEIIKLEIKSGIMCIFIYLLKQTARTVGPLKQSKKLKLKIKIIIK
jgi:hypothetical protein